MGGLVMGLHFTPDNGKNRGQRTAMLLGFAFLSGLGLGPLLNMAVHVNPSIVSTALMSTTLIFACFSLAALFAPDGHYLYLFIDFIQLFRKILILLMQKENNRND